MLHDLHNQIARLSYGEHICAIYSTQDERFDAASSFIRRGLERGDRCLYIGDSDSINLLAAALAQTGLNVEREKQRGSLLFSNPRETYLAGDEFEPERMLKFLRQSEADARAANFAGLRMIGEMSWALETNADRERIIEYEARSNQTLAGSSIIALCQYDRSRFSPVVLHDVLRTHQAVILGDLVCPNPYYEPPEVVLTPGDSGTIELKTRRMEWWLRRLAQLRSAELERERAEEELRLSEERFRTAFDQAAIGIALQSPAGRFLRVNAAYCQTMGYSEPELLQMDWQSITHPEYVSGLSRQIERMLAGEIVSFVAEKRSIKKCGAVVWDRISNSLVRGRSGEPLHVIALIEDVTERKRAEEELRKSADRLQGLSRRLLKVQEEERRHLARELHDEVGQLLTGLRLLLRPNDQMSADAVKVQFEQAREVVDELLQRVRGLSFDLRPAALDQLGLAPGLLALFERYTEQTGVLVDFKHQGLERRFSPEVETAAYRTVQEALTNVARHAGVAGVTVRVWAANGPMNVQVEDRGRGFDPEAVMRTPRPGGLSGMHERIALLGGRLTVDARPGSGTQIMAEIPLQEPGAES
jgi:PAS domain S-box-containing protein